MTLPAGTEHAPPASSAGISPWRSEPFRIFFPLGVLLAWIGVGSWLLYATAVVTTYSCRFHGLVQMQAFMMGRVNCNEAVTNPRMNGDVGECHSGYIERFARDGRGR